MLNRINEPRKYIRYHGCSDTTGTRYTHFGHYHVYDPIPRNCVDIMFPIGHEPYLVFEKDWREYDLTPNDKTYYDTEEILDKIGSYFNTLISKL